MSKKLKRPGPPWSIINDSIFVCKIGVQTGSSTNLRVLIGLAAKR